MNTDNCFLVTVGQTYGEFQLAVGLVRTVGILAYWWSGLRGWYAGAIGFNPHWLNEMDLAFCVKLNFFLLIM